MDDSRREYRYCPRCRTPLVLRELGGAERSVCPAQDCGFTHWNNPVPVVAAIVERHGHVILVRSRGWPEHAYGLVAGFLETGETPEHGVLREVHEELGIRARIEAFIGAYPFAQRNQILFTYHLFALEEKITLCERELAGFKTVPIDRLRPWPRGTGPALRDWLAARGHHPQVVAFGAARYD